jgi:RNA polymerase sigma factor (sigma-70 family)
VRWSLRGIAQATRPSAHEAFDAIVLPHLDAAHNFARWLVRDPSLAEDVLQDAASRALTYMATYEGGDAKAWLMRIVRNVAYDALAVRNRRIAAVSDAEEFDLENIADPGGDPETALVRCQDRAVLDAALADLALELRECLVLRELEGLSYKEIAQTTGVPVGTVMSRLWRARRALMEITAKGTL